MICERVKSIVEKHAKEKRQYIRTEDILINRTKTRNSNTQLVDSDKYDGKKKKLIFCLHIIEKMYTGKKRLHKNARHKSKSKKQTSGFRSRCAVFISFYYKQITSLCHLKSAKYTEN